MASLIVLCASHIDSKKRMSLFRNMLKSMAEQTVNVPFFISISIVDDEKLKGDVQQVTKEYPEFAFFIQDEKLTQFQHYAFLADALSHDPSSTWCIFTDDDDICHYTRNDVFLKHIMMVSDVTQVVRDIAVHTEYEKNGKIMGQCYHTSNEYIVHACRFQVLQEFCKYARDEYKCITLIGCDMWFTAWMQQEQTVTFKNHQWLYKYTIRPQANTSRFKARIEFEGLKKKK